MARNETGPVPIDLQKQVGEIDLSVPRSVLEPRIGRWASYVDYLGMRGMNREQLEAYFTPLLVPMAKGAVAPAYDYSIEGGHLAQVDMFIRSKTKKEAGALANAVSEVGQYGIAFNVEREPAKRIEQGRAFFAAHLAHKLDKSEMSLVILEQSKRDARSVVKRTLRREATHARQEHNSSLSAYFYELLDKVPDLTGKHSRKHDL